MKKTAVTDNKINEQLNDLNNKWKRALADYQNLEKRVDQEKNDFVKFANAKLLIKILAALDNLETAERHVSDQGLTLALKQLKDALMAEGLVKIETVGKIFDPNLMECIELTEGEQDMVIEEVRAGYILNDRILRVAQVKVGKKSLEN